MRRTLFVMLVAVLFISDPLLAQAGAGRITGTVTSAESGRPLEGAVVSVVGTRAGAVSGPDGRYTISGVVPGTYEVAASLIGYASARQSVTLSSGGVATADFRLDRSVISLEGLVVTGYGRQEAREITGAVEAVTAEEFNTGRVVSPEQLIQAKVAGVQVVSSGEPGGYPNIRIRGGTSINASNEPLIVVDGVPLPHGGGLSAGRSPLAFINPEDIESMTVLKDASSTAIYGSRGANGVILIETKSGAARGPQFTYGTSLSTSRVMNEPDLLTADQLRQAVAQYVPDRVRYLGDANTDWRDAVMRDAYGQEHTLAVAGAGENMNYRLSLGYLDQAGVLQGTDTERMSAALTYGHRLFNDRLSLRANVRGARTDDQFTPGGVLGSATIFDPTQPIRTENGFFEYQDFTLAPNNPVAELAYAHEQGTTYRSIGNIESEYRMPFLEGLAGTLRLGYDVAKSEREGFWPSFLQSQMENRVSCSTPPCPTGTVSRSNPTEVTGVLDAYLSYGRAIESLSGDLDATLGYSYETSTGDYPFFQARGLSTDLLGPYGVPAAVENSSSLWVRENRLASFFGRLNYTMLDRYLLSLSVRHDGSSRFGPGNQWGTFPAVGLGWRISEESFLQGADWLSELKLRGSWGVNGNQAIGDYLWVPDYRYSDAYARPQFGNEFVTTIRPSAVDPNIKWEETTAFNVGFDYGLLNNRLSGSLEYYRKDTDDLIFRIPVAAGAFVSNFVTTNVGSVRNQGVEASLNARLIEAAAPGDFTWEASFNAARNHNRLLTVTPFGGGGERILTGGIAGGVGSTIQVLQPGYPVNSFLVLRHRRDASGRPIATGSQLDMYVDVNGDDQINEDDRVAMEDPAPDWILGHSSQMGFRNFDLSFTMRAHLGNYVYNNLASSQGWYNQLTQAAGVVNLHSSVLDNGFVEAQFFSDVYLEDASFLRMDNLTLGYTLPGILGTDQLRLFGTVQNVFTLTGYSGTDPEAGLNGIDYTIYPRSRTFTAGVNVGF